MEATQDKVTIKKNGFNIILDVRKGKHEIIMFYLKAKRYISEGLQPQETDSNLPDENKYGDDEKEDWRNNLGLPSEMDIHAVHWYSHLG